MHKIWKEKCPTLEVTERKLTDQCQFILSKVLTGVELEERSRMAQSTEIQLLPG